MYEVVNTPYFDNVSFTSYLEKYIKESNAKLILLSRSNELHLWDKVFIEFILHGRISGKL